jgi:FKBP-type peptidyl-prolyl cis-trans isomerase FkpA
MPLSHSIFTVVSAALLLSACSVANSQSKAPENAAKPTEAAQSNTRKTATGLTIIDQKIGEGPEITTMKPVLVQYTGWLYDEKAPDKKGAKFDSSRDRGTPFGFIVGAKRVIAGWEEGVLGMKKGGQRTLIIPPELGYGARGAGGVIPPNATLIFDVEFVQFAG